MFRFAIVTGKQLCSADVSCTGNAVCTQGVCTTKARPARRRAIAPPVSATSRSTR
jgi:hypothetical protein